MVPLENFPRGMSFMLSILEGAGEMGLSLDVAGDGDWDGDGDGDGDACGG